LDLDEIWWLVSPQNPLKPVAGMAPFGQRLAAADAFADDPRIRVTDMEKRLGTRYTADTLVRLTARCPTARFVWLMGADNMASVHLWRNWHRIFTTVPVAVFDRAPYSLSCLACRAAIRFRRDRIPAHRARNLAEREAPAWTYLIGSRHPASASAIRAGTGSFKHANADDHDATNKGASR
jgi:nicotinate-nucleotide adenylyltransferase